MLQLMCYGKEEAHISSWPDALQPTQDLSWIWNTQHTLLKHWVSLSNLSQMYHTIQYQYSFEQTLVCLYNNKMRV